MSIEQNHVLRSLKKISSFLSITFFLCALLPILLVKKELKNVLSLKEREKKQTMTQHNLLSPPVKRRKKKKQYIYIYRVTQLKENVSCSFSRVRPLVCIEKLDSFMHEKIVIEMAILIVPN